MSLLQFKYTTQDLVDPAFWDHLYSNPVINIGDRYIYLKSEIDCLIYRWGPFERMRIANGKFKEAHEGEFVAHLCIALRKSTEPGKIPDNLEFGEVAINVADKIMFFKDAQNFICGMKADPDFYAVSRDTIYQANKDSLFLVELLTLAFHKNVKHIRKTPIDGSIGDWITWMGDADYVDVADYLIKLFKHEELFYNGKTFNGKKSKNHSRLINVIQEKLLGRTIIREYVIYNNLKDI